jgi:hypothetical protein
MDDICQSQAGAADCMNQEFIEILIYVMVHEILVCYCFCQAIPVRCATQIRILLERYDFFLVIHLENLCCQTNVSEAAIPKQKAVQLPFRSVSFAWAVTEECAYVLPLSAQ